MISVRYVFYSYSTESGKWKNVTFTPTDSRTGRAIEVNKKNNLPYRSLLMLDWLSEWFWFLGRENKMVQTDGLGLLPTGPASLLENEYSEPVQRLEQQESSVNWVYGSVTQKQNNLLTYLSFIIFKLFYQQTNLKSFSCFRVVTVQRRSFRL